MADAAAGVVNILTGSTKGMGAGVMPPTRRIGDEGEKLTLHGI